MSGSAVRDVGVACLLDEGFLGGQAGTAELGFIHVGAGLEHRTHTQLAAGSLHSLCLGKKHQYLEHGPHAAKWQLDCVRAAV